MPYCFSYHSRKNHNNPDGNSELDWCWPEPGRWGTAWRENPDSKWQKGEFDEEAYLALLEHFGLLERHEEFPQSRLINMSPESLLDARSYKGFEVHLYECETEGDFHLRQLNLMISISHPSSLTDASGRKVPFRHIKTIKLTTGELKMLREDFKKKGLHKPLYAKFGKSELEPSVGLPKGPNCEINSDIIELILNIN